MAAGKLRKDLPPLGVLIQLKPFKDPKYGGNSGVALKDVIGFAKYIREKCPNLRVKGLFNNGNVENEEQYSQIKAL